MEKWHIETEIVDSKITEYAQFFNVGFPKRSVMFFENVIGKIDGINSKLCILIIDKAIAGALILYSVDGFTFEVWAPSYFHVTKDKRNLSIPFLLKAQRLSSESVLNVTPNAYMCKVLEALKYKKPGLVKELTCFYFPPIACRSSIQSGSNSGILTLFLKECGLLLSKYIRHSSTLQ